MTSEPESVAVVVNPSAIGDPDQTPIVFLPPGVRALFNPCQCGGVNGFHADDCGAVTNEAGR